MMQLKSAFESFIACHVGQHHEHITGNGIDSQISGQRSSQDYKISGFCEIWMFLAPKRGHKQRGNVAFAPHQSASYRADQRLAHMTCAMPGCVAHQAGVGKQTGAFHQMSGIHTPTGSQRGENYSRKSEVFFAGNQFAQQMIEFSVILGQLGAQFQNGIAVEFDRLRTLNKFCMVHDQNMGLSSPSRQDQL